MTQAPAPDQAAALPPFSGGDVECVKYSHTEAFTRYRPAARWCLEEHNGRPRTGPLPERLERACVRCDFTWDEALSAPLQALDAPTAPSLVPPVAQVMEQAATHVTSAVPIPLHEKPLIPVDAHPSTTGFAAAGGEA
ncbi:hypothetical protein [Streptomyces sp. NPDC052179]|uniref:hypothetical protein n=1 Tax=Streptomyces sp. NPDC052179 TaxID=3155680 RepID=UPI0034191187